MKFIVQLLHQFWAIICKKIYKFKHAHPPSHLNVYSG